MATTKKRPQVTPIGRPVATPETTAAAASDLTHVEDARAVLARAYDTYQKATEGPIKRLRIYAASSHEEVRQAAGSLLAVYAPAAIIHGGKP